MEFDRRTMLGAAATAPLAGRALSPKVLAGDWEAIARQYNVTREVIQLEHGNWGMMARPVLATYHAMNERVNRETSFYARRTMIGDLETVRGQVAATLGVATEEIALTRNATEAMKALILQYNRLKPGDAVLYADLDYDSMQGSMESLAARRGVRVIKIALPEPATYQGVIDAYDAAFRTNPSIRMVLLTHASHRIGLIVPVAEITAMAEARGIDVIVDAAHSVGQLDFKLPDLKAPFIGLNLHKWFGAPLGVGAIYIRKDRLDAIDPDPAEDPKNFAITAKVHTGTPGYAAQLSVPDALDFAAAVGAARREARLKALRDRWVHALRDHPQVQIMTPDDPRMYGAITSFRLRGKTSHEDNVALAKALLDQHRVFTVHRDGLASGSCVRVTPALATWMEDLDALAVAVRQIAGKA
ncbi:MAG: aminotransferase class V-fold PLP-dependent enzyme [Novosphingobium sp.]